MDEKPDEIIGHIEAQRNELGRNLNELETRVRESTDWRTYFDRNPMLMLGAALGGGLLVGSIVGHRRTGSYGDSAYRYAATSSAAMGVSSAGRTSKSKRTGSSLISQEHRQQMGETLDHIKAALIGFGMAKAKEFLSQAIPGFDQHLGDAERNRRQRSGYSTSSHDTESAHSSSGAGFAERSAPERPGFGGGIDPASRPVGSTTPSGNLTPEAQPIT